MGIRVCEVSAVAQHLLLCFGCVLEVCDAAHWRSMSDPFREEVVDARQPDSDGRELECQLTHYPGKKAPETPSVVRPAFCFVGAAMNWHQRNL
jgi:hypothetical protein